MHNSVFWNRQFRKDFIPSTHRVVEAFLTRLLPTFHTVESEAESHTQRLWDEITSQPADPDGPDESEVAELVRDAGIEYYLGLKGIEQGVLNSCAVFVYHLFEQHLMLFHRKEMLLRVEEENTRLINRAELIRRLAECKIPVDTFRDWGVLEELRLLCNALKHGEGRSSEDLFRCAPELFRSPLLQDHESSNQLGPGRMYTPLLGEGIFLTTQKIRIYESAIKGFWVELGERLSGT